MNNQKVSIPEDLIQICREMAKVARKNGLLEYSGKFTPSRNWGGDISFAWKAGRHGEDSDEINVTSSFFVYTKVTGFDSTKSERTSE